MPFPTAWLLALLFALSFTACGGSGGGGHEPTVVSGNVANVGADASVRPRLGLWQLAKRWLRPEAVAQVPGVTVEIVDTVRSAVTDENGVFQMEVGQFGPNPLRFTTAGVDATLTVVLPFGGSYELIDVTLDGDEVTVAEQRVIFKGPISGIDCNNRLLQVLSGDRVPYRVVFGPGTPIHDEAGQPVPCEELILGTEASVVSVVQDFDTVLAEDIGLNPSRVTPSPTATETPLSTPTGTPTSTPTRTPIPSSTETPEAEPTASPTPTP